MQNDQIDYVLAYDKQRDLIEALTKALKTLARDVREYPEWKRHLDALGLADDAIDAVKEISA